MTSRARIIAHRSTGPADLTIVIPAGRISLDADISITTAVMVLSPLDPADQSAIAAISDAKETVQGQRLTVRVRPAAEAAGVTIAGGGVIAGNIGGIGSSGSVNIGTARGSVGGGIAVDVRVPAGSSVVLDLGHGDIEITGRSSFARLEASVNGTVTITPTATGD